MTSTTTSTTTSTGVPIDCEAAYQQIRALVDATRATMPVATGDVLYRLRTKLGRLTAFDSALDQLRATTGPAEQPAEQPGGQPGGSDLPALVAHGRIVGLVEDTYRAEVHDLGRLAAAVLDLIVNDPERLAQDVPGIEPRPTSMVSGVEGPLWPSGGAETGGEWVFDLPPALRTEPRWVYVEQALCDLGRAEDAYDELVELGDHVPAWQAVHTDHLEATADGWTQHLREYATAVALVLVERWPDLLPARPVSRPVSGAAR